MRPIALFGGSFNPLHVGHVLVATWLVSTEPVHGVWLLRAGAHAFGKPLALFADRVDMARAAFALLGSQARRRGRARRNGEAVE